MSGEERKNLEQNREDENREEDLELSDENAEHVRGGMTTEGGTIDTFKFGR